MADRHSATLFGAGVIIVTGGGTFMMVTGLGPTKTSGTVWVNGWFDLGLALVVLGLLVAVAGIYLHFRKSTASEGIRTVPISNTFKDVSVGGNGRMKAYTTADNFANRTQFGDNVQISVWHIPGRPDTIADLIDSPGGQKREAREEREEAAGSGTLEGRQQ